MADREVKRVKIIEQHGAWGAFHFLAFIGAAIYFISKTSGGFWEVILALLQALVWPAYFVFNLLKTLGV